MKKQEEKRLRRFGLKQEGDGVAEGEAVKLKAKAKSWKQEAMYQKVLFPGIHLQKTGNQKQRKTIE